MSCLMREGLTANITCMPSVTAYYTLISEKGYYDIIICKWDIKGVDHYDTKAQANTDCKTIGYSTGLTSTGYIPGYRTTPTNDQAMLTKYIDSSVCGG